MHNLYHPQSTKIQLSIYPYTCNHPCPYIHTNMGLIPADSRLGSLVEHRAHVLVWRQRQSGAIFALGLSSYLANVLSSYLPIYQYSKYYLPIFPSTSYLPIIIYSSCLPIFLSSYLPIFLSSHLPILLSSYLPIILTSYLPTFLSINIPNTIFLSSHLPPIFL